jgi:hypothetical protein
LPILRFFFFNSIPTTRSLPFDTNSKALINRTFSFLIHTISIGYDLPVCVTTNHLICYTLKIHSYVLQQFSVFFSSVCFNEEKKPAYISHITTHHKTCFISSFMTTNLSTIVHIQRAQYFCVGSIYYHKIMCISNIKTI